MDDLITHLKETARAMNQALVEQIHHPLGGTFAVKAFAECPDCGKPMNRHGACEACPGCPECGANDFSVQQYDFGMDSETGYRDAGERGVCRACGCNADIRDFAGKEAR